MLPPLRRRADPRSTWLRACAACGTRISRMTGPVFVSSDVLLAARDKDQPLKRTRARAWLETLSRHGLGRTSTLVLAEYYVRATNNRRLSLSSKEVWDDVRK